MSYPAKNTRHDVRVILKQLSDNYSKIITYLYRTNIIYFKHKIVD